MSFDEQHTCTVCHWPSNHHDVKCRTCGGVHFPALCCNGCDCRSFEEAHKVTIFECGPKLTCQNGKEHDYSGWINLPDGSGTAVCANCGHRAIDDANWL